MSEIGVPGPPGKVPPRAVFVLDADLCRAGSECSHTASASPAESSATSGAVGLFVPSVSSVCALLNAPPEPCGMYAAWIDPPSVCQTATASPPASIATRR